MFYLFTCGYLWIYTLGLCRIPPFLICNISPIVQYLNFITYKYLLICCLGSFRIDNIYLWEKQILPTRVQYLHTILFIISLIVSSENTFFFKLLGPLLSFPLFSGVISFIWNTIRFTATICILFWFPQYPGLFFKLFQTLKFPLFGVQFYGVWQLHRVLCLLPLRHTEPLY